MVGSCGGLACCRRDEDFDIFSGWSPAKLALRWRKESNNLKEKEGTVREREREDQSSESKVQLEWWLSETIALFLAFSCRLSLFAMRTYSLSLIAHSVAWSQRIVVQLRSVRQFEPAWDESESESENDEIDERGSQTCDERRKGHSS